MKKYYSRMHRGADRSIFRCILVFAVGVMILIFNNEGVMYTDYSVFFEDGVNILGNFLVVISFLLGISIFHKSTALAKEVAHEYEITGEVLANDIELYGEHDGCMDIGKKYMLIYGIQGLLIPLDQCLYVFTKKSAHAKKLFYIISFPSNEIEIHCVLRNGDIYFTTIKKKYNPNHMLAVIKRYNLNILTGYSDQLYTLLTSDFDEFVKLVDKQRRLI